MAEISSASDDAGDETAVVPGATAAAPELAWSLIPADLRELNGLDEDSEEPVGRQSWRNTWGVAAVLLAGGAALALAVGVGAAGWVSGRSTPPMPVALGPSPSSSAAAAPTVEATVPPPPQSTVTVTAVPPTQTWTPPAQPTLTTPTVAADPGPDANDRAFLQALRNVQININDQSKALFGAQRVCGEFRDGFSRADVIAAVKGGNPTLTELGAVDFVADSVAFYCPQYR